MEALCCTIMRGGTSKAVFLREVTSRRPARNATG